MTASSSQETQQEKVTPHLETTTLHIKGILAATDLSEQATIALEFAARLAKQFHSRLHLLYTVMPQLYIANTAVLSAEVQKVEIDRAQEELRRYASKIAELRTLRHEEIALCGPTIDAIDELVEMKGIDLLVMGSHGRSGLGKMMLGSVAEAAIRRLHCPVLVVGPHCARRLDPLKPMLLATELPAGSLRAAQYAMSFAREATAPLTVVHVLPERVQEMGYAGVSVKDKVAEELRQLVPHDPELRKHVHFEIATGKPAEEIVRAAKNCKAGLIVMGAREHTVLADHAPWATLSDVIRESHCPVFVVSSHFV
jgi:nucleotide-binding universal stress UspA family protein